MEWPGTCDGEFFRFRINILASYYENIYLDTVIITRIPEHWKNPGFEWEKIIGTFSNLFLWNEPFLSKDLWAGLFLLGTTASTVHRNYKYSRESK